MMGDAEQQTHDDEIIAAPTAHLHDWNGDSGRECACPECTAKRRRLYLDWCKGDNLPERR